MNSCVLSLKVTPGAARDEVQGWLGDALKVRIQAPPTDGRANAALCLFLSKRLDLHRTAVTLASGSASRQKRISIAGLSLEEVKARLATDA
jgi:uncharacterized protein (TIGR00251 family)